MCALKRPPQGHGQEEQSNGAQHIGVALQTAVVPQEHQHRNEQANAHHHPHDLAGHQVGIFRQINPVNHGQP